MAEGNTTLVLDYKNMCNDKCKCGGQLGFCEGWRKIRYKTRRCEEACHAWFPGDVTLAAACKKACQNPCGDKNSPEAACKPQSQADYLSRWVTDQQIIAKYGYDFDPTTGVGSQLLNRQRMEAFLPKIFNIILVIAALVVVYLLANKFLAPAK
jgi:hypothetical protein